MIPFPLVLSGQTWCQRRQGNAPAGGDRALTEHLEASRVVEGGLKPGDRIVTQGLQFVQSDSPVTPDSQPIKDPGSDLAATSD